MFSIAIVSCGYCDVAFARDISLDPGFQCSRQCENDGVRYLDVFALAVKTQGGARNTRSDDAPNLRCCIGEAALAFLRISRQKKVRRTILAVALQQVSTVC